MTEQTHGVLAGDLLLKIRADSTGIEQEVAQSFRAAERAAEASGTRMVGAAAKVRAEQLRVLSSTRALSTAFSEGTASQSRMLSLASQLTSRYDRLTVAEAAAAREAKSVGAAQAEGGLLSRATGAARRLGGALGPVASVLPGAGVLSRAGAAGGAAEAGAAAGLGPLLGVAAGVGGGIAAIELARRAAGVYTEEALAVRRLQQATGASAEDASRLSEIFRRTGVDTSTAATAVLRLGRNIEQQPAKFRQLGVEVARTKDGGVDLYRTVLNLNDAFHAQADAGKRAELVLNTMGRGGAALLPILAANRDTLKGWADEAARSHEVFSQRDLNNAFAYQNSITSARHAIQGLEIEVGQKAAPIITDLANVVTGGVEAFDKAAHAIGTVQHAVDGLDAHLPKPLRTLDQIGRAATSPFGAFHAISGLLGHHQSAASKAAAALDALSASQSAAADTASNVSDVVNAAFANVAPLSSTKLVDAAKTAADNVTRSTIRLHDAEQAVARDRQNTGAPSALSVLRAEDTLFAARERLQKLEHDRKATAGERELAVRRVTEAELRLSQLEGGTGAGAARKLAADENRLRLAQLAGTEAAQKAHDAQAKLAQARKTTALSPDDVLKSIVGQEGTLAQRGADIQRLLTEGAGNAAVQALIQIDQKNAGTLHQVALHASQRWITSFNAGITATTSESDAIKKFLASDFAGAGQEWGTLAAQGVHASFLAELQQLFGRGATRYGVPAPAPTATGGADVFGGTRRAPQTPAVVIYGGSGGVSISAGGGRVTTPVSNRAMKLSTGALAGAG